MLLYLIRKHLLLLDLNSKHLLLLELNSKHRLLRVLNSNHPLLLNLNSKVPLPLHLNKRNKLRLRRLLVKAKHTQMPKSRLATKMLSSSANMVNNHQLVKANSNNIANPANIPRNSNISNRDSLDNREDSTASRADMDTTMKKLRNLNPPYVELPILELPLQSYVEVILVNKLVHGYWRKLLKFLNRELTNRL